MLLAIVLTITGVVAGGEVLIANESQRFRNLLLNVNPSIRKHLYGQALKRDTSLCYHRALFCVCTCMCVSLHIGLSRTL